MKIEPDTIVYFEDLVIPAFNLAIFDLDTGTRIESVISADTGSGSIERYTLDENGVPLVNEAGDALVTVRETRRIRVVATETDREIFRTTAAFDVLKVMITG